MLSLYHLPGQIFCFAVKMIPFGFSGGGEYIQSNEDTFYSVFHITYAEQFVWNCSRGQIALIFAISMTIHVMVWCQAVAAALSP